MQETGSASLSLRSTRCRNARNRHESPQATRREACSRLLVSHARRHRSITYEDAAVAQRAATDKGLTKQTWALQPKLIEVDRWVKMPSELTVIEAHPEVSFAAMNGAPMRASKHSCD